MSKKKVEWTDESKKMLIDLYDVVSHDELSNIINSEFKMSTTGNSVRKAHERYKFPILHIDRVLPKILIFDIETMPMEAYVWSLWQDNVGLNMLKEDWSVLSYAAKWYKEDEMFYQDVEGQKNLRDDKKILKGIWKLLDEAEYVVAHNGNSFDVKKLNARFIMHGMQPPSSYRRFDTLVLAKRHFKFTSNKLEYLTDKLCTTYKKLKHGNFPGFSMWKACLDRNPAAFKEMKKYNEYDVLSLEELFDKLLPWESATLFNMYTEDATPTCTCGSTEFKKAGYYYTNSSKFQKHKCKNCGSEYREAKNLLKKDNMKNTSR